MARAKPDDQDKGGGAAKAALAVFEARRRFPLTRLHFPDVSLDAIPRFQKIFDDSQKAWRKNKVAIGEGCFTYKTPLKQK